MQDAALKVLLVEDNDDDALIVQEEMSGASNVVVDVHHVRTLDDAIKAVRAREFDIVLLDLGLSSTTGLETLDRFRAAEESLPVVVLTGLNDEEIATAAVARGAQDYLVKGDLSGRLFVRTLQYARERHRLARHLKSRAAEVSRLYEEAEEARRETLAILESGPGAFVVLRPGNFEIVTASDSYLRATGRSRENLTGQGILEAFPDDPNDETADGVRNLRISLDQVAASREADTMAVQRYPIPRPAAEGGGFEERYWSPVNSPVLGGDGSLLYIIHKVEDVTDYIRSKYGPGGPTDTDLRIGDDASRKEVDLLMRAREIQDLNRRLARREGDLRQAFEGAAVGISVTTAGRKLEYVNTTFCRIVGYSQQELNGTDVISLIHPEDRERSELLYDELAAGAHDSFVVETRYLNPSRGDVWTRVSVSLLRTEGGLPSRVVAVSEDITDRKLAELRARVSQYLVDLAGRMARLGGWELDLSTGTTRWSDVVCDIHGVPRGTVVSLEQAIGFYAPEWREVIERAVAEAVEREVSFDLELEILSVDGRRVWVRAMGEAVRDQQGAVRYVRGAFQDISVLKASEQTALDREAAFHDLSESMPHIVWGASGSGEVDFANSKLEAYCGVPVPELLGEAWLSVVHPGDRAGVVETWSHAVEAGAPYRSEFRIRRHDGEYRWHLVQAQPVHDAEGPVVRWYGSASDVHDRRLIEEEARSLAERLTSTLESVTDAVYTVDENWRFTFLNTEAERLLERPRETLLGRELWEEFGDARGTAFEHEYVLAVEQGTARHFEAFYPGLESWFGVHAYPSPEGLTVFFRNVTAERRAHAQLKVAETRFRNVARATSDAIWDWDLETDRVWWSDGIETTFGYMREQLEPGSSSWTSRIHSEDRDRVEKGIHDAIDGGAESWEDEYRFRREDGSCAHVFDRGFIVRDPGGAPVRMVGGMSDETRHMEAVERIKEQADLLDRAQDAILVMDLDHEVVFWNAGAERIYGWTRDEVTGRSVRELLHADPNAFDAAAAQVLREGEWSGEMKHRTNASEVLTVEGRWSLVRGPDGDPRRILAINTDVTERKKLVTQFLRAQRLESIGTLAGGIAHDLNNVLAPIMMSIGLLKLDEDDPEKVETLDIIESSARHGADMVKQVLGFARGVEGAQVAVDLRHIVDGLSRVLRDTFPKGITLRQVFSDDLWPLRGDPTQVHQVLLNLLVNARDAMPDGGTIRIAAENIVLDEQYAAMSPHASPGPHVRLTVADSGLGMSPEVVDKAFDPFFTTKRVGEGSGLGLSTVAAIIKSHGGFVHVYSEPEKGTTFRIYFPATTREESLSEITEAEPRRGQGELILVVDDENSVREITRQTLEAFGYRVVTARDGAEAVAIFGKLGDTIDVVLTDIMMPIMDGVAAINALKHLDPSVKIIAASGLGANGGVARAADRGVEHFLPKPYTAETLLDTLSKVLDEEAAE